MVMGSTGTTDPGRKVNCAGIKLAIPASLSGRPRPQGFNVTAAVNREMWVPGSGAAGNVHPVGDGCARSPSAQPGIAECGTRQADAVAVTGSTPGAVLAAPSLRRCAHMSDR